MGSEHDITGLLGEYRRGDHAALGRVFEIVYAELKRKAHAQLRDSGSSSLATTDLVHEAYLKLAGGSAHDWEDRGHFYRVAARAMRQIVIDRARRHLAEKRGAGGVHLDIDRLPVAADDTSEQLVALDETLARLEGESEQAAQVVELTYFGGLSVEDAALAMGISTRTVKRLRQFGRAYLHHQLGQRGESAATDT
jgi:RNA polymerase sigma factor (TIGR02999 family)